LRRSTHPLLLVLLLALLLGVPATGALAAPGDITLASTSDSGEKGNSNSDVNSVSGDGTAVAFESYATNLDPADSDTTLDVYVKSLATGEIVLASTSDAGVKGNGVSIDPSLSGDGTDVAFWSLATNLDPADPDTTFDVYVKDVTTGDIVLASTSDAGTKGNAQSTGPSLSGDGTTVAFYSSANNLDPADTDSLLDIYLKDVTTGDIMLASTSDTGVKSNGGSYDPSLSDDGTAVSFYSYATNLDPADTDASIDVYVKDLTTGDIALASTSDAGTNANNTAFWPSLSEDGKEVAFYSSATNLDAGDTDTIFDIYVKDLTTGDIVLASASDAGVKGNGASFQPSLSDDGSRVSFHSEATNLDPDDLDTEYDVYLKDLSTGDIILASTSNAGVKGHSSSYRSFLSADGTKVGFSSDSSNLDPADTDTILDAYLKEVTPPVPPPDGDILLVSTSDNETKGNDYSAEPSLSGDGTSVAFFSAATNLDPADTDSTYDVYVKDLTTRDIVLASTSDTGTKGNDWSTSPSLSGDGTSVAFFSAATNLDPADTDSTYDVYVKDLTTGDIVLASTSDAGTKSNGHSFYPSLSADGTAVAFYSWATNLDPADTDTNPDIYVKDLTTGDIVLASTSDNGTKGNISSLGAFLSADGTRVAFWSAATNLDPADPDNLWDIYVKDLTTGDVVLASTSDAGIKGNASSFYPSLSADGTEVAFFSWATNLHPADPDSTEDVYVKDLTSGDVVLASTSDAGLKGNGPSNYPSLSADGATVAFYSDATNLDPADPDSTDDVYVKDLTTGDVVLASTSDVGLKGNSYSYDPSLSDDGTRVAFNSYATNLDPADTDFIADVYMKDLATPPPPLAADLSLTKSDSPDPVFVGEDLTYTLTVHNFGPDAATGVTLTDDLPSGVTYQSDDAGCTLAGETLNCELGSVPAGDSTVVNVVVRPDPGSEGTITNTASVVASSPADPNTANNSATEDTEVRGSADLSLTKSDSPDPVAVGSDLAYTLIATNAGPSEATEVTLTDELPSTVVFAGSAGAACSISGQNPDGTGGTVACSLVSMPAGTSVTVRLLVSVTASGPITNTASVAGAENDPAAADNEATVITTVSGPSCTMIGTQRADNLTGTSGADVICGLGGRDTIHGMGGADVVLGGSGGDTLSGGAGNDQVRGGAGNDTLVDTEGTDVLIGEAGADYLNSEDATSGDTVRGGSGTDTCVADQGDFVTGCP
jgi:uncharacterized repeat protein (TIGR01451 family)